jgi:hypothetical protein
MGTYCTVQHVKLIDISGKNRSKSKRKNYEHATHRNIKGIRDVDRDVNEFRRITNLELLDKE